MFTVKAYSYTKPDMCRFKKSESIVYSLVMNLEAALGQDQEAMSMSVDLIRLSARPLVTAI